MMRWMGVIAVSAGLVFSQGCGKKEEDKRITIEFNVKKEEPQAPEKPEEKKAVAVAPAPAPTVPSGPAPTVPSGPAPTVPSGPPPKTEAREVPPSPAAPPKAEPRPEPRPGKKKEEGRIAAIEPKAPPPPPRPRPVNLPDDFLNKEVYVRTTLHALKHKLFWQNFLSGTPIVPGTPATITVVKGGGAVVTINGVPHKFAFSGHKAEPRPAAMLSKFFSPADPAKVLPPEDLRAAREPEARSGMSKAAVLALYGVPYAVGANENPTGMLTLDEIRKEDRWVYLVTKKEKLAVVFGNGRVSQVQRGPSKGRVEAP
ncbi:MAG: hypothetical protein A2V83_00750 [Nitrospirae bacterium RBG_16_64_22]|nr:MAG: hypothetical protein A2V83_00750 [Nitrospirae bacterium RBG_16_64_22]